MKAQKIKEAMHKCEKQIGIKITIIFLIFILGLTSLDKYYFTEAPSGINYLNIIILMLITWQLISSICHSFEKVLISLLTDKDE